MKFLLIVLLILFIGEVLTNKIKNKTTAGDDEVINKNRHPAEYDLR